MSKEAEVSMSLRLAKPLFEAVLNKMHENKIYNVRNDLKNEKKKADSINAVIRECIEICLIKKKKK